jgi:PRTRC genetic system protein C
MKTTVLKRVFMSNGNPLSDPDPSMSPAAIKDFYSAMYPELLNAEVQGPVVGDAELVFTFHRTTGTKGRTSKEAAKAVKGAQASFMQRLEVAAGEASTSESKHLPSSQLTVLSKMLWPSVKDKALQLPGQNCPLLI